MYVEPMALNELRCKECGEGTEERHMMCRTLKKNGGRLIGSQVVRFKEKHRSICGD